MDGRTDKQTNGQKVEPLAISRCDKNVSCKRFSHFSNKNYSGFVYTNIFNFNESLTNNVVNFEQPAPDNYGSGAGSSNDQNRYLLKSACTIKALERGGTPQPLYNTIVGVETNFCVS